MIFLLFIAAHLLGQASAEVPAGPTYVPQPGLVCPADDIVDFTWRPDWTERLAEARSWADAGHARVRAEAKAGDSRRGPATVRIYSEASLWPERVSIVAVRTSVGTWAVEMASAEPDARDLPPERSIRRGVVRGPAAARLEALLKDPCLYEEPAVIERHSSRPAENDYVDEALCVDGEDLFVEIEADGRRHDALHECRALGLTAEAIKLVRRAVPSQR